MSKTITLSEANQRFSHCVREVEAGEEFVITRKGQPDFYQSAASMH